MHQTIAATLLVAATLGWSVGVAQEPAPGQCRSIHSPVAPMPLVPPTARQASEENPKLRDQSDLVAVVRVTGVDRLHSYGAGSINIHDSWYRVRGTATEVAHGKLPGKSKQVAIMFTARNFAAVLGHHTPPDAKHFANVLPLVRKADPDAKPAPIDLVIFARREDGAPAVGEFGLPAEPVTLYGPATGKHDPAAAIIVHGQTKLIDLTQPRE